MDLKNLTPKQKKFILCTAAVLLAVIWLFYSWYSNSETGIVKNTDSEETEIIQDKGSEKEESLYLEITGQVNSPGVYQVNRKMMVIELIELAGGLTSEADLHILHKDIQLSQTVENQTKVYIPALFEAKGGDSTTGNSSSISAKININSASAEELETLPDIGASTANKIIQARPFSSLDDLKNVPGIGEKTYNNIVSLISI